MTDTRQTTYVLIITFLSAVIFIGICVTFSTKNWLEAAAYGGEVITGIVATIAVVGFIYEQRRDKSLTARERTMAAIEQLEYFEQKIIPLIEKNGALIRAKNLSFEFETLKTANINEFSLEWLYLNRNINYSNQVKLTEKDGPLKIQDVLNLLNKIELLSQKMIHLETIDHPALAICADSYVDIVETYAAQLLTVKFQHPQFYEAVKIVYEKWKNKAERTPLDVLMSRSAEKIKKAIKEGKVSNISEIIENIKKRGT